MKKVMNLSLFYAGGGGIERELVYEGDTLEDIARQIEKDENQLLCFMRTKAEESSENCLVFCGFMFTKTGLLAAQITEGVI